jgi:hypothetical protein
MGTLPSVSIFRLQKLMNSFTDCGDQLSSNDDYQLGSYLRFHNSVAESTMSFSDTSVCDVSSVATPVDKICEQTQCAISPPLEIISFKKSGVATMDQMDMLATTKKLEEPIQMEIHKKKKEKKKKKDSKKKCRSQSKRCMQRRSSWTASQYNHGTDEETHNHVPIEVFSTSLHVDTPSEPYREFQTDHLTYRHNHRKSRSIGYFSSYLDNHNNNDDDDDGVIRCFKSSNSYESTIMFEEQSSKSEYQIGTLHSNELKQLSVVANDETSTSIQDESQKWCKSDIIFLSERNTSNTQVKKDDDGEKWNDTSTVPEDQRKMKRRNSWHSSFQHPQETSSSRVNHAVMNSSHRSLTYVIDLKAREKVWVAKDSQELDHLPTFQGKKERKSWFGKSRSGHIETSTDIVIVSTANMPQDTETASINSLTHGLTCVQLTASGDVTTMTYEP